MSTHSYSRCWLHLIWETLRREKEEQHRKKTFTEEYQVFVQRYSLEWREESR